MFVALGYHLDSICRLAVQRLLGGTDLSGGFSGFAQASEALLQAEWARAQLVQIQAEQEIALARYRMAQLAVLGSAAVSSQPGHSPQRRIAERVQPLEVICPEKLAEDVMICRKSRKSRRRRHSERSTMDSDSADVSELGMEEKENRSF
mmetsp:Transcript_95520/g.218727  ORF Transcript_95520/g.218727 Transcript_95520/m.218727 type:complete len:149 (-) Transcript_95520:239-685(-)